MDAKLGSMLEMLNIMEAILQYLDHRYYIRITNCSHLLRWSHGIVTPYSVAKVSAATVLSPNSLTVARVKGHGCIISLKVSGLDKMKNTCFHYCACAVVQN